MTLIIGFFFNHIFTRHTILLTEFERTVNASWSECVALFVVVEILKNKACPLRLLPSSKRKNRWVRLGNTKHPTCWARMSWKAVRYPSAVGGCHTWNGKWLKWNGNQNPISDRQVNNFLQINKAPKEKSITQGRYLIRNFQTTALWSYCCKYCFLIG